ncbi:hypothetical protein AaE_003587, partial [Aphanomyces astaci]
HAFNRSEACAAFFAQLMSVMRQHVPCNVDTTLCDVESFNFSSSTEEQTRQFRGAVDDLMAQAHVGYKAPSNISKNAATAFVQFRNTMLQPFALDPPLSESSWN